MTKYIVVAVNKLTIGSDIGAFSGGTSIYSGYPFTYSKIKKYNTIKEAETAARRFNRTHRRYNAYVQEVEIHGPKKKVKPAFTYQRSFTFQNPDR